MQPMSMDLEMPWEWASWGCWCCCCCYRCAGRGSQRISQGWGACHTKPQTSCMSWDMKWHLLMLHVLLLAQQACGAYGQDSRCLRGHSVRSTHTAAHRARCSPCSSGHACHSASTTHRSVRTPEHSTAHHSTAHVKGTSALCHK